MHSANSKVWGSARKATEGSRGTTEKAWGVLLRGVDLRSEIGSSFRGAGGVVVATSCKYRGLVVRLSGGKVASFGHAPLFVVAAFTTGQLEAATQCSEMPCLTANRQWCMATRACHGHCWSHYSSHWVGFFLDEATFLMPG